MGTCVCSSHRMVLSALLRSSVIDFVSPISCPRFCGRHVTATIEDERFLDCKRFLGFRAVLNAQWWRHKRLGHMARASWWSYLHDPWVSRYFSVVWALVFKPSFPSLFPISLIIALSSFLSIHSCDCSNLVPAIFSEFLFDWVAPFQGTFLFSSPFISFSL